MGGVAGEQHAAHPPPLGHQRMEPVRRAPLDVLWTDVAEPADQADGELLHARGRVGLVELAAVEAELVATPPVTPGDDDVRTPRLTMMHAETFLMGIVQRVDDDPRIIDGVAHHVHLELAAGGALRSIATDHVVGANGCAGPVTEADGRLDADVGLRQPGELHLEGHLHRR